MRKHRPVSGNFIADVPVTLWVLFMVLFFPLMDFGTVCLRSTFLYFAVHNAARNASRARSFLNPIDGQPSATRIAQDTITTIARGWSGIRVTSMTTQIVTTNINTLVATRQSTSLGTPADDTNNTYQLEVIATGSVDPFIRVPWFGSVPGLTGPMNITMADRQYFENPQGLNI